MKTLYSSFRLIFSGDTLLLAISILVFLAAVANATQWPVLRTFRFCGICTMLFSVAFGLLAGMEVFKHPQRRTIAAAIIFLAAAAICLSNVHIVTVPAS
jgi:D-alanyl-lipoteichoic acid acyltransferase DltB (MBOAT superfamily)